MMIFDPKTSFWSFNIFFRYSQIRKFGYFWAKWLLSGYFLQFYTFYIKHEKNIPKGVSWSQKRNPHIRIRFFEKVDRFMIYSPPKRLLMRPLGHAGPPTTRPTLPKGSNPRPRLWLVKLSPDASACQKWQIFDGSNGGTGAMSGAAGAGTGVSVTGAGWGGGGWGWGLRSMLRWRLRRRSIRRASMPRQLSRHGGLHSVFVHAF